MIQREYIHEFDLSDGSEDDVVQYDEEGNKIKKKKKKRKKGKKGNFL